MFDRWHRRHCGFDSSHFIRRALVIPSKRQGYVQVFVTIPAGEAAIFGLIADDPSAFGFDQAVASIRRSSQSHRET